MIGVAQMPEHDFASDTTAIVSSFKLGCEGKVGLIAGALGVIRTINC
jgi:hypothetical protein